MHFYFPLNIGNSYFFSALSLAVVLASVLLLIKFLAIMWLNDPVLFGNPIQTVEVEVPKILMSKVNVPFTFKLNDKGISTFEGVHCIISSEVRYRLEAFWGVSIADLHFFLRQSWDMKSIPSLEQTPLKGHYQQVTSLLRGESHDEKNIKLVLSENKLKLGIPPRQYYPLVVFLVRDSPNEDLQPEETIALVNIVHIKDTNCTLSSSLLAQYLKQANGRLTTLKQLYMASANVSDDSDDSQVKKENTDPLCIVCQVYPTSRALLPCRHTCVCAVCFNKIYGCPLCRSPITSYFLIRSEEYYKESDKISYSTDNGTLSQWFHDRVADFLGFER